MQQFAFISSVPDLPVQANQPSPASPGTRLPGAFIVLRLRPLAVAVLGLSALPRSQPRPCRNPARRPDRDRQGRYAADALGDPGRSRSCGTGGQRHRCRRAAARQARPGGAVGWCLGSEPGAARTQEESVVVMVDGVRMNSGAAAGRDRLLPRPRPARSAPRWSGAGLGAVRQRRGWAGGQPDHAGRRLQRRRAVAGASRASPAWIKGVAGAALLTRSSAHGAAGAGRGRA